MRVTKTIFSNGLIAFAISLTIASRPARADTILYATNLNGSALVKVDVTTNTVTTITNTPGQPDSLVFAPNNNIAYSLNSNGEVALYNLLTHTNTILAVGMTGPRDVALDPGGLSILVSNTGAGEIDRVPLAGGAYTPLVTGFSSTDGIAYDASGSLFVVLNGNEIARINPTTGQILNTLTGFSNSLDGLTYDPYTGELWASSATGLWEVPTNLSTATSFASGSDKFDGLESDGHGNLFIAFRTYRVYQYNIPSNTLTPETFVSGLDDLAPITGLGSSPTPEPSSVLLLGSGLAALGTRLRKKM
jgi:hypothetical protein